MTIVLFSRNESVRIKWSTSLQEKWQVHQSSSIKELFVLLKRFPIEIILLHRGSIDENELHEICRRNGGCKVFVFSDRPDDKEGMACLQLGCVGYANTYIAPQRMKAAMEAVESGLVWVGTSLMQYLIKGLAGSGTPAAGQGDKPDKSLSDDLSNREYQVARLVAEGLQNSEIAARLDITERTVKAHLSSVYAKTGTKGRLSLALLMRRGEQDS